MPLECRNVNLECPVSRMMFDQRMRSDDFSCQDGSPIHPTLHPRRNRIPTSPTGGYMKKYTFTVSLLLLFFALEGARQVAADEVTVWNANAGEAATAACIAPLDNPLHESRIYAMMHIAIHDAVNAIDRRSSPYAFDAQAEEGASPDAAVAAAARDVLVAGHRSTTSRDHRPSLHRRGRCERRGRLHGSARRDPGWSGEGRMASQLDRLLPRRSSP